MRGWVRARVGSQRTRAGCAAAVTVAVLDETHGANDWGGGAPTATVESGRAGVRRGRAGRRHPGAAATRLRAGRRRQTLAPRHGRRLGRMKRFGVGVHYEEGWDGNRQSRQGLARAGGASARLGCGARELSFAAPFVAWFFGGGSSAESAAQPALPPPAAERSPASSSAGAPSKKPSGNCAA